MTFHDYNVDYLLCIFISAHQRRNILQQIQIWGCLRQPGEPLLISMAWPQKFGKLCCLEFGGHFGRVPKLFQGEISSSQLKFPPFKTGDTNWASLRIYSRPRQRMCWGKSCQRFLATVGGQILPNSPTKTVIGCDTTCGCVQKICWSLPSTSFPLKKK